MDRKKIVPFILILMMILNLLRAVHAQGQLIPMRTILQTGKQAIKPRGPQAPMPNPSRPKFVRPKTSSFRPKPLQLAKPLAVGTLGSLAMVKYYLSQKEKNACADETLSAQDETLSDCELKRDSCDYYLCREAEKSCGPGGYNLAFGHKNCMSFLNNSQGFSPYGKTWLSDVRLCLQEKLSQLPKNSSCEKINDFAHKSHAQCYLESGFCQLHLSDFFQLTRLSHVNFMDHRVFSTVFAINHGCFKNHFSKGFSQPPSEDYF